MILNSDEKRLDMNESKEYQYSLPANIIFIIKNAWQIDKTLLFAPIAQIPINVLLPLLATYLSKYVVQLVTEKASEATLISYILTISASLLILYLLNNFISAKIEWRSFGNRFKYIEICNQKITSMDYEALESPIGQTKMQKAQNTLMNNNVGTQQIFAQLVSIASNIAGLITYSAIIFFFNPWIVLLLFAMTIVNYFIGKANNKWNHKNKDNWVPIDRKINYIRNKAGDFETAKDIRLYGMSLWFNKLFDKYLYERLLWHKKGENRSFALNFVTALMNVLRDGIAYVFLIYKITNVGLSAADFVLYFALIGQYSGLLLGIIGAYSSLHFTSLNICDLREFLDLKDKFNRKKGSLLPTEAPEIELKHVSYKYPESENATLKDINITIKCGEKIALVGLNGAGKTTLVKLLCGLYMPTEGEILIDGKNIMDYNIDEYYSILSVVFQDILMMPISIAKNIALCNKDLIDNEKLNSVLKLSGLYDKVQTLPEKEDTLLLKSIHENATDLSGGEKQKLALARALYKNGSIIILDEPTAALDPIAENEMYQKYNQLTTDTTSVFISHRLSSTRFCDRILFLENGVIAEQGSHDSLMALKGKYADLFEIQSHYYKDGVAI